MSQLVTGRLAGAAVASLDDVQMSFLACTCVHSGRAASGPGQCADPGILYTLLLCAQTPAQMRRGARPRGPYLIHEATISDLNIQDFIFIFLYLNIYLNI